MGVNKVLVSQLRVPVNAVSLFLYNNGKKIMSFIENLFLFSFAENIHYIVDGCPLRSNF
jgi:hypothetical protein